MNSFRASLSPDAGTHLVAEGGAVSLRLAGPEDAESLRRWRNRHRSRFFHREIIGREEHARWFAGHLEREGDFLFIVLFEGEAAGCFGLRKMGGRWDFFNVIRGRRLGGSKGMMSRALGLVASFARDIESAPLGALVLKDNPAFRWYQHNGFCVVEDRGDHWLMLRKDRTETT